MWEYAWLFILESFAIVITNATTIVIFVRKSRLHRKQFILIVSQAMADLLIGLVSVPMYVVLNVVDYNDYPANFLDAYYTEDGFLGIASLSGLACLALERAHATFFPFRHSALGTLPYVVVLVFMWIVPFSVAAPAFVVSGNYLKETSHDIKLFIIGTLLTIITCAYVLIVLKVRCVSTQAQHVNSQENKRLTVTLAIVTALSLLLWLPYQVLVQFNFKTSALAYQTIKFLQYANSFVNSVIYAFRMREIKREVLRMFSCCRGNQVGTESSSVTRQETGL